MNLYFSCIQLAQHLFESISLSHLWGLTTLIIIANKKDKHTLYLPWMVLMDALLPISDSTRSHFIHTMSWEGSKALLLPLCKVYKCSSPRASFLLVLFRCSTFSSSTIRAETKRSAAQSSPVTRWGESVRWFTTEGAGVEAQVLALDGFQREHRRLSARSG